MSAEIDWNIGKPYVCQCGHLTDEFMGFPPDAKAARESPGPHHTSIRCTFYRRGHEVPSGDELVDR